MLGFFIGYFFARYDSWVLSGNSRYSHKSNSLPKYVGSNGIDVCSRLGPYIIGLRINLAIGICRPPLPVLGNVVSLLINQTKLVLGLRHSLLCSGSKPLESL